MVISNTYHSTHILASSRKPVYTNLGFFIKFAYFLLKVWLYIPFILYLLLFNYNFFIKKEGKYLKR